METIKRKCPWHDGESRCKVLHNEVANTCCAKNCAVLYWFGEIDKELIDMQLTANDMFEKDFSCHIESLYQKYHVETTFKEEVVK